MKATYIHNPEFSGGYGIFSITGLEEAGDAASVRCSVQRSSDRKFLGSAQWQDADSFLKPQFVKPTAEGVELYFGPEVIDHLDVKETLRLTLEWADGQKSAPATLRELSRLIYSPEGNHGQVSAEQAPPPLQTTRPAQPVAVAEQPAPPPVLEPAPEGKSSIPALSLEDGQTPAGKPRGKILLLIVLCLFLLAGAVAAFLLLAHEAPGNGKITLMTQSPLEQARAYLSGPADAEGGYKLAQTLDKTPQGADAAFLLYEDAAQKGNGKAMLALAAFYDPAVKREQGSIIKDPEQAWVAYGKAQKAGEGAAEEKMRGLKAWAEAEAAKDSEEAKAFLDKIK